MKEEVLRTRHREEVNRFLLDHDTCAAYSREPVSDLFDAVVHEQERLLDAGSRKRFESPSQQRDI